MIPASFLLKLTGIGRFFRGIPKWVYLVLLAVLLAWVGTAWHGRVVSKAISAAETRGETRERVKWQKATAQEKARQEQISREERKRYDEAVARIDARADAQRVRGPGKAAYHCPAAPAASGRVEAAPEASTAVAGLPDPERQQFIVMPFDSTVSLIRNHDRLLEEASRWRSQHQQLTTSGGR